MKILKVILFFLIIILIVSMLMIYWFQGVGEISLTQKPATSNFSLGVYDSSPLQFYENLRYSDSKISYRVADICTLQKRADAERAFEILEEQTILVFYDVKKNEEILITCEDAQRIEEDFFVAGEGGPVNITKSGQFSVVSYGQVLLIRQSECSNPNIALHEILHALGFDHSSNQNNIMYHVSSCSQTLGEDIPELINELYSIPSKTDLVLDEVYPVAQGRYLNVNMSIKNVGLIDSGPSEIKIYTDDIIVETIDVEPLGVGAGIKFIFQNLKLKKSDFNELRFVVEANFEELDKKNNEVIFELKE